MPTIKNFDLKLSKIAQIGTEIEIHTLLRDLLIQMGFKNVLITHQKGNRPELGKDLIGSYYNGLEEIDEWYAFVVKKGNIKGNATATSEIRSQVEQCFEHKIKSIKVGHHNINKVRVVTNGIYTEGCKETILDSKIIERGNVVFWDGEQLVKFIDKHFNSYWYAGDLFYEKYISSFLNKIKDDYHTRIISVSDEKSQKLINSFMSPKLIEFSQDEEGKLKNIIHSADSIVKIPENCIITGISGSGKTTLFRKLSLEIIEQNSIRQTKNFIPILIKFIDIFKNGFDILKTVEEYFSLIDLDSISYSVEELLQSDNIVLFIDALDEIAKHDLKISALESINTFKKAYPNVKIYCTSRPNDSLIKQSHELGFSYYHLEAPTDHQIEYFITEYFGEDVIKSSRLLNSLRDSEILNKLPKTPLTISLITILFDEKQIEIPATISNLYSHFSDLMLGKLNPRSTIDIIGYNVKHRIISLLAFQLHQCEKQSISIDDFNRFLEDFTEERGQTIDSHELIRDFVDNCGILYENDRNELQFKHLSFQEYYTAIELFQYKSEMRDEVISKFNNIWWQNVIIFYAGMSTDAPSLLEKILNLPIDHNIESLITNTSGLGFLLQALYNTPIEIRRKGIHQSLNNSVELYELGLDEVKKIDSLLYKFSKYNLLGLFERWFNMYHKSISLIVPIKEAIKEILQDNPVTDEEKFYADYKRLLGSFVCAAKGYEDYELLDDLLKNRLSNDVSLFALTDTLFKHLGNKLDKYDKEDPQYRSVLERINRNKHRLKDALTNVNMPANGTN